MPRGVFERTPEHNAAIGVALRRRRHGVTHGLSYTPAYKSWSGMMSRCYVPTNGSFLRYGGRGISVCERWRGPEGPANFYADMGERPEGMTLDRIDPDGNYEPSNCRWVTPSEQTRSAWKKRRQQN